VVRVRALAWTAAGLVAFVALVIGAAFVLVLTDKRLPDGYDHDGYYDVVRP
jgi:hypothetical protein